MTTPSAVIGDFVAPDIAAFADAGAASPSIKPAVATARIALLNILLSSVIGQLSLER